MASNYPDDEDVFDESIEIFPETYNLDFDEVNFDGDIDDDSDAREAEKYGLD